MAQLPPSLGVVPESFPCFAVRLSSKERVAGKVELICAEPTTPREVTVFARSLGKLFVVLTELPAVIWPKSQASSRVGGQAG